jgi:hypothetical protein
MYVEAGKPYIGGELTEMWRKGRHTKGQGK